MVDTKENPSSGKNELKEIFTRIIKRDFSGNTGQAVKNSFFQISAQLVQRGGSLVLTVILARILMPELFGLYNLALSTIIIFLTLSDLGVGSTLITFVSKALGGRNKKLARSYLVYVGKIKFILVFASVSVLLISAKFIANNYYQKPIFLALIAGSLYILFAGVVSFSISALQSFNYFRGVFHKEIVFQTIRIILIPLAAVISLKYALSNENVLFYIFLAFGISYIVSAAFTRFSPYRKHNPLGKAVAPLELAQKKEARKFFWVASTLAVSGIFFGYVDKVMLGHFIAAEFIGYYSAAFNLVGAFSAILGFGALVLLPIFSRLGGDQLERGMKRSIKSILALSGLATVITLLLAYFIVWAIYGKAYFSSVNLLRAMSPLLVLLPLIGIYGSYFMSQKKPHILVVLLGIATILNIVLNYILISSLLSISELAATYGAVIATVFSNIVYLAGMIIWRKRKKG